MEVGKNVTEFKVGQRVGVGAQVGSCGECKACKDSEGNGEFFEFCFGPSGIRPNVQNNTV